MHRPTTTMREQRRRSTTHRHAEQQHRATHVRLVQETQFPHRYDDALHQHRCDHIDQC